MFEGKNQAELSDVPRRHGEALGRLTLVASVVISVYTAVAVGTGSGRAKLPGDDDAIGLALNRAEPGQRVRVALPGEVIDFPGWNWTPGPVYYTAATGALQQAGGVPFAVAITTTRLLVIDGGVAGMAVSPTTVTFERDVVFNGEALATEGLEFGSDLVAGLDDVSRHIDLYGGVVGFNVSAGRLNYVMPAATAHAFRVGGTDVALVTNTGLQGAIGTTIPSSGAFTTLSAASATVGGSPVVTEATGDVRFVNTTGDTMTGDLLMAYSGATITLGGAGLTGPYSIVFADSDGTTQICERYRDGSNTLDWETEAGADLMRLHATNGLTMSVPIVSSAGSDANAAIAGPGDVNTGLLWPAADTLAASCGATRVWTATATDVEFPVGISFGGTVAPGGATDLSRHIELHSSGYGFSITSSTLNHVASGTTQDFYTGGVNRVRINASGLNVVSGTLSQGGVDAVLDSDIGATVQAFDADLSALAALGSTGLAARTASNTWAQRTITAGQNISVTNGNGVSGNPTIALDRVIEYGTFSPTYTGVTSIEGLTADGSARYVRVGEWCYVWGRVSVNPSVASGVVEFTSTLAIASNLTTNEQLQGTAVRDLTGAAKEAWVIDGLTTDLAEFRGYVSSTNNIAMGYHYSYVIV